MAGGRTLHVRCTTWEQVEVFHTRKLRKGKLLAMKVPFAATVGAQVTLGLELPNEVVIAIDGTIAKSSPIEGDTKTWIEVELHGFTPEVVARIKAFAAGVEPVPAPAAPPPAPAPATARTRTVPPASEELPADERLLFQHLTAELRRLRQVGVHEVLGVPADADAEAVRRGWMSLVRRHHPDLVARRGAPAISHLAEELTILCNRAYERMRALLVVEGRGTALGPQITSPPGWLVGFDDLSSIERAATPRPAADRPARGTPVPPEDTAGAGASVAGPGQGQGQGPGDEAFESRARAMLGDGDADNAQEVLAAALCVYPRSKALRSLYYVASAIAALGKGELMLATSQLETALAHHDECTEAAQILDQLRRGTADRDALRRLFQ